MLAVMGLLPWTAKVTADRLVFDGKDLMKLDDNEKRSIIGKDMTMIFQEPLSSLNPCFTVGFQIIETLRLHLGLSKKQARTRAIEILREVGIPAPERRIDSFPHQMSGGMNQRVMIAMAIACKPKLLIADEPTTALDVTIQAQILELLDRLRRELELAVVLITHDLSVVAETCDRVVVMYAGSVVEEASAATLFATPSHPYTRGLLAALPRLGQPAERGKLPAIPGQVPDASDRPPGCAFHPRCPDSFDRCQREAPPLFAVGAGQRSRCFLHAPP
jgi:dipeptide transport system ATP-binding protein